MARRTRRRGSVAGSPGRSCTRTGPPDGARAVAGWSSVQFTTTLCCRTAATLAATLPQRPALLPLFRSTQLSLCGHALLPLCSNIAAALCCHSAAALYCQKDEPSQTMFGPTWGRIPLIDVTSSKLCNLFCMGRATVHLPNGADRQFFCIGSFDCILKHASPSSSCEDAPYQAGVESLSLMRIPPLPPPPSQETSSRRREQPSCARRSGRNEACRPGGYGLGWPDRGFDRTGSRMSICKSSAWCAVS